MKHFISLLVGMLIWLNVLVCLLILGCIFLRLAIGLWFPEATGIAFLTLIVGLILFGMHAYVYHLQGHMAHGWKKVVLLSVSLLPGLGLTLITFGSLP